MNAARRLPLNGNGVKTRYGPIHRAFSLLFNPLATLSDCYLCRKTNNIFSLKIKVPLMERELHPPLIPPSSMRSL